LSGGFVYGHKYGKNYDEDVNIEDGDASLLFTQSAPLNAYIF
jgi:hypothetical protein